MKKLFLTGVAAVVLAGFVASCSHDDIEYASLVENKVKAYQAVFEESYGTIDPLQTWGFNTSQVAVEEGTTTASIYVNKDYGETYRVQVLTANPLTDSRAAVITEGRIYNGQTLTKQFVSPADATHLFVGVTNSRGFSEYKAVEVTDGKLQTTIGSRHTTRSMESPTVPHITIPTTATLAEYIDNATELNATNNAVNAPGYYYWNSEENKGINKYEDYVINYKITGEWTGLVNQMPTLGYYWTGNWNDDHTPEVQLKPRSLYLTGTWTIPSGTTQSCGQGQGALATDGIIIVGSTGHLIINGTLNMNNQARLIVLPGGRVSGSGLLSVNNGNAVGNENYNGGTISVSTFNNNFGKFYNYGKLNITQYQAGGKESNFYNHGIVHIKNAGSHSYYVDPNARIFNACQWYCEDDMRAYIIEMIQGSYFYVGGELMTSAGNDGTNDPSYVSLAAGALMQIGSLHNTNTIWTGPTSGYPVVEINEVTQLDWTPGSTDNGPLAAGYFMNNIYISIHNQDNQVWGNAGGELCKDVFWRVVANGQGHGNGGVTNVAKGGADVVISPSSDFVAGVSGCTPGYNGEVTPTNVTIPIDQGVTTDNQVTVVTTVQHSETRKLIEQGRVFCEDLGQISTNDLDFNDVVFDAYIYEVTPSTRTIIVENGVTTHDVTVTGTKTHKATIVLLAAGGTLPLSLAGLEVHNQLGHRSTVTIINTIVDTEGSYGNAWTTHDPVVLGTDFNYSRIVDIPIIVYYANGKTLELEAFQGWAPHKILVPIGTKWVKERVDIATAYTDFHSYVNSSKNFWEGNINQSLLYIHPKDTYKPQTLNYTETVLVSTEGPTTTYRNAGSTTTDGGYQGEDVLSRRMLNE